jgi:two-component system sensor histidine kinase CiaH
MDKQLAKQQRRFFLQNFLAFATIFLILGVVVFQLAKATVYQNVDKELTGGSQNTSLLKNQIKRLGNVKVMAPPKGLPKIKTSNSFQQQVVMWSKNGTILNKKELGSRLDDIKKLSLNTSQLGKITTLELSQSQNELNFHSIVVTAPKNSAKVAYIQLLTNTNQVAASLDSFLRIFVLCFVLFFLLAIFLSYWLSVKWMKPIVQSWKSQQQFVENASHEFRTPLTIMQIKLEQLFTTPDETILEHSEAIAQTLEQVTHLSRLASDLLFLARMDGGSVALNQQVVFSAPFVGDVVEPFKELAKSENKTVSVALNQPLTIQVGQDKIAQLLIILLDNALKYTKAHGLITVKSYQAESEWIVQVADTGIGIAADQKATIFERFYRGDVSRNKAIFGNGIGLAIATEIAHAHQGTLTVSDNQPVGSIFTLRIPVKS